MPGLYLYTLKIGHKSCKLLSILNKLPLQKKFQYMYVVTHNVFLDETKNTTTTKQKLKHNNPCRSRELNQNRCVATVPPC